MPNWKKVVVSGSDALLNTVTTTGDIIAGGNIYAEQYVVSSSVTHMTQSFSSGSTIFGDTLDDTHIFTGSLFITGLTYDDTPLGDGVVVYDTASGQFYYTGSYGGGGGTPQNAFTSIVVDGDTGNTIEASSNDLLSINNVDDNITLSAIAAGDVITIDLSNDISVSTASIDDLTAVDLNLSGDGTPEIIADGPLILSSSGAIIISGSALDVNGPIIATSITASISSSNIQGTLFTFTDGTNQGDITFEGNTVTSGVAIVASASGLSTTDDVEFVNITSSGNISASGHLFASTSNSAGSYNSVVVVDTASGQFYYTGSYGGGGGGTTITGSDTQVLFFDGDDNPAGDTGLTYDKDNDALNISGPVTASSAQIGQADRPLKIVGGSSAFSSFSTITGVGGQFNIDSDMFVEAANKLYFRSLDTFIGVDADFNPESLEIHADKNVVVAPDNLFIVSESAVGALIEVPLTASNNISASGYLIANSITSSGGGSFLEGGVTIDSGDSTEIYVDGNITASGNISASGHLFASTSNSAGSYNSVVVVDTASGQFYYTGSYGAGGTTITGTDTQVLFFDGDDTPAGDAGFTYNKTTDSITTITNITASGVVRANQVAVEDKIYHHGQSNTNITFGANFDNNIDLIAGGHNFVKISPNANTVGLGLGYDGWDTIISGSNIRIGGPGTIPGQGSGTNGIYVTSSKFYVSSSEIRIGGSGISEVYSPALTEDTGNNGDSVVLIDTTAGAGQYRLYRTASSAIGGGSSGTTVEGTNRHILYFNGNNNVDGGNTYGETDFQYNDTAKILAIGVSSAGSGGYISLQSSTSPYSNNLALGSGDRHFFFDTRIASIGANPIGRFSGVSRHLVLHSRYVGSNEASITEYPAPSRLTVSNLDEKSAVATIINLSTNLSRVLHLGAKVPSNFSNNQESQKFIEFTTETAANGDGTPAGSIEYNPTFTDNGFVIYYGNFSNPSDKNLKKNIVDTKFGVNDLMKFKVKDFNWKKASKETPKTTGLIAQEVQEIFPNLVSKSEDKLHLKTNDIVPMLIKAVQDQQKEIEELKQLIKDKLS